MGYELKQMWEMPKAPKPIVFVGTGGIINDAHLPAYKQAGFPMRAAFDLDATRAKTLADAAGLDETYDSLDKMVAACGTDVVYDIATPPHVLADILPKLPDNAAVLMQKPMGANQAQAAAIRKITRDKNLKAAVNFQLRFSPMMLAAKDAITKGMIGELLEIEVHLNIYTPWQIFPFLIPIERVEIAVHSIHYLDTIRALAGNPKGVFARTMGDPRSSDFAQTRTSVILDYGDKLRGLMSINHNHQNGRDHQSAWFRIEGTEGCMMVKLGVCYDYPNGEPDELWFCKNGGEWEQIELQGGWFIDSFMGTMANVQRFDSGEDTHLYAGVEDAYQTMALVEACFEANEMPSQPLKLD